MTGTTCTRVRAGMATMPGREACLPLAVDSISSQVDELVVGLNDGAIAPSAMSANVRTVKTLSDDRAKFLEAPGWRGVFLSVDDDIVYPPGYVEFLASRAARNPTVPVGFHGSLLTGVTDDYYDGRSRTILRYFEDVSTDTTVDIIGTGTLAFVPESIGFSAAWLENRGVTDLEFSAALRWRNITPVVLAHRGAWIKPVDPALRPRSISRASRLNGPDLLNVRALARKIVREGFL